MNITSVLARISEGDRQAFAEVVETFQRPLFGFLGRMGLSRAVAAEIAQETFVRAWRHLEQFEPEQAQFSTWLFSIARNIALNELTRASGKHETAIRKISRRPWRVTTLSAAPFNLNQNSPPALYSPSTDHSRPLGVNSTATRLPGHPILFNPMQLTPETSASTRA